MDLVKLFGNQYLPLLSYLYEKDCEIFKEQLHHVTEDGKTFLSQMVESRYSTIEAGAVDFLLQHDYDFFKKVPYLHNNPRIDFISVSRYLPDAQSVKILQHSCEKKPQLINELVSIGLLHWLFDRGYYDCVEYMITQGVDIYCANSSGRTLKDLAMNKPEALMKFNALKDKYFPENAEQKEQSFREFIQWIGQEASRSYSSSYSYEQVQAILQERFSKFNREQQEEVISHLTRFKQQPIVTKAIKLIGEKSTTYQAQYIPLWARLSLVQNHKVFHQVAEDPKVIYSSYYDKQAEEKRYFIFEMMRFLGKNNVPQYAESGYESLKGKSGASNLKNYGIQKRVLNLLSYEFLSSINEDDHHNTWFVSISKNANLFKAYGNYLNQVFAQEIKELTEGNKQKLTSEQINIHEAIQEALNHTWFAKDQDGKYALEHFIEQSYYFNIEKIYLFKHEFILEDMEDPIYTTHQKEALLNALLNKTTLYAIESQSKYLNALIDNMQADEATNWSNIHINVIGDNEENKERIEKSMVLSKIRTMQMKTSLHQKLTSEVPKGLNNKRKI